MFWISPLRRAQLNCRRSKYTSLQSLDKLNTVFAERGFPAVSLETYLAKQDRYDLMMLMGYERFCDEGGWE